MQYYIYCTQGFGIRFCMICNFVNTKEPLQKVIESGYDTWQQCILFLRKTDQTGYVSVELEKK